MCVSSSLIPTAIHVHTNSTLQPNENAPSLTSTALPITPPMAIASAIPQTFILSLPNHHPSRFSTLNYLIPPKKSHRIHLKFLPVAFNGVQFSHSSRNFCETALPIRALGHNSKFLQVGPFETRSTRRIQAKSMDSDNNFASTSLQRVKNNFLVSLLVIELLFDSFFLMLMFCLPGV